MKLTDGYLIKKYKMITEDRVQILDDYEKARILDRLELEPADLPVYVDQCKKLRELIEKRIEEKKKLEQYSKCPVYALEELQKLLEDSKK